MKFAEERRAVLDSFVVDYLGGGGRQFSLWVASLSIDSSRFTWLFPKGLVDVVCFHSDCADVKLQEIVFDCDSAYQKAEVLLMERVSMNPAHLYREFVALGAREYLKIAWRVSGAMWSLMGDRSTDWNYYSKRAILAFMYIKAWSYSDSGKEGLRGYIHTMLARHKAFFGLKARVIAKFSKVFSGGQ